MIEPMGSPTPEEIARAWAKIVAKANDQRAILFDDDYHVLLADHAALLAQVSALQAERDEALTARDSAEVASDKWFITHLSHRTARDALGKANGELFQRAYEAERRAEKAEAEVARMREALEKIDQWAKAYPLKVFPEPDFAKVHEALLAAGLSLDQVSASNMRHVVEGVGKIARAALSPTTPEDGG
jgi:phosphoglycolate phosphatase-like HAD superfamily hydrolase